MSPRPRDVAPWLSVVLVGAALGGVPGATLSPATAAATSCAAFFDANGDGHGDLVIGSPSEDITPAGIAKDSGVVTIVYGDAAGVFGATGSTLLTQEDVGLVSQAGDRFGVAVATADLNGDSCADLAVGVPGENGGAGAVVVVWGSATGLNQVPPQLLAQGLAPVGSKAEAGDGFGSSLAVAGSLPSGGAAALWVGSPGEDVGSVKDAGMVTEIKASAAGLLGAAGVTHVHQDSPGIPGTAEAGDRFGERLSGGARTLLVGVPREDVGSVVDAGAFFVVAVTSATRTWTSYSQGVSGVPGVSETGDRFGATVGHNAGCAAKDETWVIGAPGEDLGAMKDAGLVTVRDRASKKNLTLRQGAGGVPGTAQAGAAFGGSLAEAAGSLVIGSPRQNVGAATDAGAITAVELDCSPTGVLSAGLASAWTQSTTRGLSETGDHFGATLGVCLVDTGGPALEVRLVVGAPGESEGSVAGSGNVTVLRTAASGLLTGTGATAFGQAGTAIVGDPEPGDGFGAAIDSTNALVL